MPAAPVGLPGLAAGLGRLLLRVTLRERGGLALARAPRLRQQLLQLGDAGVSLRQAGIALGQAFAQGLNGTAKLGDLAD
jgi:hypothetical protein